MPNMLPYFESFGDCAPLEYAPVDVIRALAAIASALAADDLEAASSLEGRMHAGVLGAVAEDHPDARVLAALARTSVHLFEAFRDARANRSSCEGAWDLPSLEDC
ncbi:hypothetical protein [Streptacidiphilus sp. EB103A]|uniref:hypothetical protein n=1 Tax=Streptacidiphilus sp. EB103A TaxID=3156275 RepID=UPI00351552BE